MKQYDVVIAGAGPAGSAAATILGKKGHSVLLVDKDKFPRDKTCGDGISYKAFPALKKLELDQIIKSQSPFTTNGYTLVFKDGAKLVYQKPEEEGALIHIIQRHQFDNILLEKACSYNSVNFLPNSKVEGLIKNDDGNFGVKLGGQKTVFPSLIMDATGVNSILGKANKDPKNCALAVRGYYENVSDLNNTIEIYFSDEILPGYFWIFPTSKTSANIGCGTFQNIIERKKINIKDILQKFVENHPVASKKLKHAKLSGTIKGGKIPLAFGNFNWSRVKNNLMLLGDAGGFVNPITAEGISYAIKTGIFAGEVASQAISESNVNEENLKLYDTLWQADFSSQYKIGDIYNQGISQNMIQNYVSNNLTNSLTNLDLSDIGKSYEYLVRLKVLAKAF